jgi:hypothetical protein
MEVLQKNERVEQLACLELQIIDTQVRYMALRKAYESLKTVKP